MISVVVQAHNEEKAIGTILDDLIDVLEGQAYEIVVVDGGSTLANYLSETKIPDLNTGMRIFIKEDAMKFFNIFGIEFFINRQGVICEKKEGMIQ